MEEERESKSTYQSCPYMQQPPCMMQGMYMNPCMMNQQQMQQPMDYPGMMGQMQQPMMGQMDQSMGYPPGREDEDSFERAPVHGGGGNMGHGGHYGHGGGHYGHYGHYSPSYYYGDLPYYPYPYLPYYPYPTPY